MIRLLLVFFLGSCIGQAARAQDPVEVSPEIYSVLFENDEIRVLELQYQPGERDAPHSHPAYTVLALNGGTLTVHEGNGEVHARTVQSNEAALLDAVTLHWGENTGDTTIRAIAVEFKTKQPE
jgi:quercetin dioxygenase-like cupin family protein